MDYYSDLVLMIFGFHLLTHFPKMSKMYSSSFACLVKLYSTLTGISAYTFFDIRFAFSRSFNRSDKTVLLIPGNAFFKSLNRIGSFVLIFFKTTRAHAFPKICHISETSHWIGSSIFLGSSTSRSKSYQVANTYL